jgi:hypothetical protein
LTHGDQPRLVVAWYQAEGSVDRWYFRAPQARKEDDIEQRFQRRFAPTRVVMRIDLGETAASAVCWLDPAPGREPAGSEGYALLSLPAMSFSSLRVGCSGQTTILVADVRIGQRFDEVLPTW